MSSHYTWKNGPDIIKQHSIAKHKILKTYLAKYYATLVGDRPRSEFKLTVIDGFAGGGEYYHEETGELILGSPHICLQEAQIAEFEINKNRSNKVRFDITHIFVEAMKPAFQFLTKSLHERGYGSFIGQSIQLRHGKFEDEVDSIIEFIQKKTPKSGRSIFILDQFGYKDVSTDIMRRIFSKLDKAEIILTFGVDSLFNFANEVNLNQNLSRINVPNVFANQTIEKIKESEKNWRGFVQSTLYQALMGEVKAKHYTPFFINNSKGHGVYWLVHLSQHHRARSVMTDVHWGHQTNFSHYGGAGLDMFNMLGYDPRFDNEFQQQSMFAFDKLSEDASISKMMEQIPRLISNMKEGCTFGEFYEGTCNQTPASLLIYKKCLELLIGHHEILVESSSGTIRSKAHRIELTDRISKYPMASLFLP
ncbi:three-Cys-motif partner protein TcmP [Massilia sp. W12]|uniref:three-Cys-motif partner protein TcmP n=1 Tax=Massilia sp. W12 TaxID=3126507 RepID=UPI0030D326AF